jgi:hypothetical protein
MTRRFSSFDPLRAALAAAAILTAGCGGGGSPASASYPSVTGSYGGFSGLSNGAAQQRWTGADGTVTNRSCSAVTAIREQNGAAFSGTITRLDPCNDQANLSGEVAQDKTIAFTVAQARWGTCNVTSNGRYTGVVTNGALLANGRVSLTCDDGRSFTVEEQVSGSLTAPPTTG